MTLSGVRRGGSHSPPALGHNRVRGGLSPAGLNGIPAEDAAKDDAAKDGDAGAANGAAKDGDGAAAEGGGADRRGARAAPRPRRRTPGARGAVDPR